MVYLLNNYFDFAGNLVTKNGVKLIIIIGDAFLTMFGLDSGGNETFRDVKPELE